MVYCLNFRKLNLVVNEFLSTLQTNSQLKGKARGIPLLLKHNLFELAKVESILLTVENY